MQIPRDALAGPTSVTLDELSGGAPQGLVGSVWQLGPADAQLLLPITITFTPPQGAAISDLVPSHRDATGYWFRDYGAGLSIRSSRLTAEALVSIAAQQDLAGSFQLSSTEDSFNSTGQATLQYLGSDPPYLIYAVSGTIQIASPTLLGCNVLTQSTPLSESMPLSIAELQPAVKFRWAINGRWDVDCGSGAPAFVSTNFDTLGITNLGCDRRYGGTPLFDPAHLIGQYQIDCLTKGGVTASWDLAKP